MGEHRDLTGAFEGLFGLLGRGSLRKSANPPVLEPIVLDYYAETSRTLEIFKTNLRLSEALLRRHPQDYRLACLYATGALSNRGPGVSSPSSAAGEADGPQHIEACVPHSPHDAFGCPPGSPLDGSYAHWPGFLATTLLRPRDGQW